MNCILITTSNFDEYAASWGKFVQQHPKGNIFQSPEYFSIFQFDKNENPVAFILTGNNGEICGVLSCIVQFPIGKRFRALTSRVVTMGGPLTENDDPQYVSVLLREYTKFSKAHALYSHFRNLNDLTSFRKEFEYFGFTFEEHLNIQIDLTRDESEIWNDIHSKRRNEIRKAEKAGLTFKILNTPQQFEESYEIVKALYREIRLPVYSKRVFERVFNEFTPTGKAVFFGAYFHEKMIGTIYTLCYKGILYNWFAASYKAYYSKCPNDFLPWKIFLWAKENGFTTFDWGGAGKPEVSYGVRDYKSKFGGSFVNYGRYEKIHKPLIFTLAKAGFSAWQKIKI